MLEELKFLTKTVLIEHPFNFPIAFTRKEFAKEVMSGLYCVAPNHFRLTAKNVLNLLEKTGYIVPLQVALAVNFGPRKVSGDILICTPHGLIINPRWKVQEYIVSFSPCIARCFNGAELRYMGKSKFLIVQGGQYIGIYYDWREAFQEFDWLSKQWLTAAHEEPRLSPHLLLTYFG